MGSPPGSPWAILPDSSLLPQMAPAGHLDPAHNPGPPGLHAPNLGGPPGPQLHHPNPPPASRQPLGPVSSGPVGELAFTTATGVMGPPMSGAGEAPEPALDVSTRPHAEECVGAGAGGSLSVIPRVHMLHRREDTDTSLTSRQSGSWSAVSSFVDKCLVPGVAMR